MSLLATGLKHLNRRLVCLSRILASHTRCPILACRTRHPTRASHTPCPILASHTPCRIL
jgi:hypothetical protein